MKRLSTAESVTVPEAVRRTGIGIRQFRRAIAEGELDVFDFGWPRLSWRSVLSWAEARKRKATVGPSHANDDPEMGC